MFCEKCGAKLPDTAQFCTSCGNRVNILKKVPDTTVLLSVKPAFNFWYIIFPYIIDGLFMILLFTVPVAVIFPFIGMILGLVGMVIMAICISISTVFKKREYDNYSYDFYKTKVIYRDNYLNKAEKEVKYKYIREVVMHQTFMQRLFNLGNIKIYTDAETGFASGIYIKNIENVQDVVNNIKAIIDV